MLTIAVVLFCLISTAARAWQRGVPLESILSFPSQWFNWTFMGRDFQETFSAFVGLQVRERARPYVFWYALYFVLDLVFLLRERHHCAESLYRVEKARNENRESA